MLCMRAFMCKQVRIRSYEVCKAAISCPHMPMHNSSSLCIDCTPVSWQSRNMYATTHHGVSALWSCPLLSSGCPSQYPDPTLPRQPAQRDVEAVIFRASTCCRSSLRPDPVAGVSRGSYMNIAVSIALYATMCKEQHIPLRYTPVLSNPPPPSPPSRSLVFPHLCQVHVLSDTCSLT